MTEEGCLSRQTKHISLLFIYISYTEGDIPCGGLHSVIVSKSHFSPRVFPVNCYLVKENDGITLVDAGLPSSANPIQKAAKSLGLPISRILLTHAHGDHVGALDRLHESLPTAEIMISERDSRLLSGDTSIDDSEPQTKIRGSIKPCQTKPTRFLKDGDRIGNLEVIPCPGHTPGHVAFLDVRDLNTYCRGCFSDARRHSCIRYDSSVVSVSGVGYVENKR